MITRFYGFIKYKLRNNFILVLRNFFTSLLTSKFSPKKIAFVLKSFRITYYFKEYLLLERDVDMMIMIMITNITLL